MESLIEQSVSANTRCFNCGGLVYAVEKKKTTNHIYHNRCFRCRICKRNLTESSLNEEGDDIYCTNCYRKKQLGDCNSLAFKKAADERAQYVHNIRHPDEPPPTINLQPPVRRDFSRHPSITLHQLERRFLSYREPKTKDSEKFDDNYRRLVSLSHPLTVNTSFSAPGYQTNVRRNSSFASDDLSPSLHFSPVFSPFPNSTATTPKTPGLFNSHPIDGNQSRINRTSLGVNDAIQTRISRTSINLNNGTPSPSERKYSTIINGNQKQENKDKKESKFYFPDKIITPIRRRSSSVNYSLNSRKTK